MLKNFDSKLQKYMQNKHKHHYNVKIGLYFEKKHPQINEIKMFCFLILKVLLMLFKIRLSEQLIHCISSS